MPHNLARFLLLASVLLGLLPCFESFVPNLAPLKTQPARAALRQDGGLRMSTDSKKPKAKGHQLVSKWLKSDSAPELKTPVVDIHPEGKDKAKEDYSECNLHKMERILRDAQRDICAAIQELDGGAKFGEDDYTRPNSANSHLAVVDGTLQTLQNPRVDGGGGRTMVLADGKVFEKAGIAMSVIYGEMPAESLNLTPDRKKHGDHNHRKAGYKKGEKVPFASVGLSAVIHPMNPFCPTIHFNYRYFETDNGHWWFGGGTDITPAYVDEEDMKHFHGVYKAECDKVDPDYYKRFKAWADDYFYIAHRGETRGLGGIFFDDLNDRPAEELLQFVDGCLKAVPKAYVPIIEKHRDDKFTEEQKIWQQIRRGRYVEFNLVYDRGVLFGLQTGLGRMESILMSLPRDTRWEYCHEIKEGSEEEKLAKALATPREWV